jgi:hypothetical protein
VGSKPRCDWRAMALSAVRWRGPREEILSDLNTRIEAMHRSDTRIAWAFVIGLWLAIGFVAYGTWDLAPSGGARVMLLIGGALVLIYNTAAIMAMLRHYREDRDFMYGLDIQFMDAARAAKGK